MNSVLFINKQTLGYPVVNSDIIKGDILSITLQGIPAKTSGTPYNWSWSMREEPTFANGQQDWGNGTLIQSDSGALSAITDTSFTTSANIPVGASQFDVGKSFSLEIRLTDPDLSPGDQDQLVISTQAVLTVGSVSPNPTSPNTLQSKQWNHGEIVLTGANLTAINFGGGGLDLTTLTGANYDTSTPTEPSTDAEAVKLQFWGRQLAGDGLTFTEYTLSGSSIVVNSADSNFADGELFRWRYIGAGSSGGAGSVSWGDIGGTLSNQTDLQTALDAKQANISGLSLVDAGTPANDDKVLIQDTSDSNNFKYVDVSALPSGGGGGAVDSVNGQTGVVVLDADDISDSTTTNKYTTQAEIDKLAGIEAGADVTDETNVLSSLNGASITTKATPANVDRIIIQDSADSNNIKVIEVEDLPGSGGDVTGPASSTDNAIPRFDGVTGKIIQSGVITADDVGNLINVLSSTFTGSASDPAYAEGKMWYNSTDDVLKYYNNTTTPIPLTGPIAETVGYPGSGAKHVYTEGSDVAVLINQIIDDSTNEATTIHVLDAPAGKHYTFNSFIRDKSAASGEFNQSLTILGQSKGGVVFKPDTNYRAEFFKTHNWDTLINNSPQQRGGSYQTYFDNFRVIYPFNTYVPQAITTQYYTLNNKLELGFDAIFKIFGADIHMGERLQMYFAPEVGLMRAYPSGDWALSPALNAGTYNVVEDKIECDIIQAQVGSYLCWGSHDSIMSKCRIFAFPPSGGVNDGLLPQYFIKTDGTGSDLTGGSLQITEIHTYGEASTPSIIGCATTTVRDSEIEGGRIILNTSENVINNIFSYYTSTCVEVLTGDNTIDIHINKVNDSVEDYVVRLGDSAGSGVANNKITIRGNIVAGTNIGCKYVNFENTNGYNRIDIQSYKQIATIAQSDVYDGTPNANDRLEILVLSNSAPYEEHTLLDAKQDTLVSGTNIKTINGNNILGSGNVEINGSIAVPTSLTGNNGEALLISRIVGAVTQKLFGFDTNGGLFQLLNSAIIKGFSGEYTGETWKIESSTGVAEFQEVRELLEISQTAHGLSEGSFAHNNSGTWAVADASAESTTGSYYVFFVPNLNAFRILKKPGIITKTAHGFPIGSTLYLATDGSGAWTSTKPSTTGQVAIVVGRAVTANEVFITMNTVYEVI